MVAIFVVSHNLCVWRFQKSVSTVQSLLAHEAEARHGWPPMARQLGRPRTISKAVASKLQASCKQAAVCPCEAQNPTASDTRKRADADRPFQSSTAARQGL